MEKSKFKNGLIWSLNTQSKIFCSIMIAISICAVIGCGFGLSSKLHGPEGLLYLLGCVISLTTAIGFRLLRNICKAIIIILENDSDRCNPENNERQ